MKCFKTICKLLYPTFHLNKIETHDNTITLSYNPEDENDDTVAAASLQI